MSFLTDSTIFAQDRFSALMKGQEGRNPLFFPPKKNGRRRGHGLGFTQGGNSIYKKRKVASRARFSCGAACCQCSSLQVFCRRVSCDCGITANGTRRLLMQSKAFSFSIACTNEVVYHERLNAVVSTVDAMDTRSHFGCCVCCMFLALKYGTACQSNDRCAGIETRTRKPPRSLLLPETKTG